MENALVSMAVLWLFEREDSRKERGSSFATEKLSIVSLKAGSNCGAESYRDPLLFNSPRASFYTITVRFNRREVYWINPMFVVEVTLLSEQTILQLISRREDTYRPPPTHGAKNVT